MPYVTGYISQEVQAFLPSARREWDVWAAHTRRQRREVQRAEAQPQSGAGSRTQRHVARRSRQRARPEMLTVAIRGPLAAKMRELAAKRLA